MTIDKYEVIQIENLAWRIEDSTVRALLFAGNERALLVDSTNGSGNVLEVVRRLTDLPVMLVNTHADEDHIGCNHLFAEAYMHPAEFAYYAQTRRPGDASAVPLQDGEMIDLGGRRFEVILIPGHTPGSIALLDREARVLVSGDSVSGRPVYIFGRVRSLEALQVSLRRIADMQDAFDRIYPSHGPFPVGREQIANELRCAELLQLGKLPPLEPPFPIPAKMFLYGDAGFYFSPPPKDGKSGG